MICDQNMLVTYQAHQKIFYDQNAYFCHKICADHSSLFILTDLKECHKTQSMDDYTGATQDTTRHKSLLPSDMARTRISHGKSRFYFIAYSLYIVYIGITLQICGQAHLQLPIKPNAYNKTTDIAKKYIKKILKIKLCTVMAKSQQKTKPHIYMESNSIYSLSSLLQSCCIVPSRSAASFLFSHRHFNRLR